MNDSKIDYSKFVDEAMYVIVYKVLKFVEKKGLPAEHYFFITFMVNSPGVKIPKYLKDQYEHEMTIVLQHQFSDLAVDEKGFGVSLSFEGVQHKIFIPFDSMTTFADPWVQFGLQFGSSDPESEESENEKNSVSDIDDETEKKSTNSSPHKTKKVSNIVSLEQFKKSKK